MATDADFIIQFIPLYPVDDFEQVYVQLYKMITKRDMARMVWQSSTPPQSLREFLNFCSGPRACFVAMHLEGICGFFWLEDIVSGIQCELSGWIPFRYRGDDAHDILRQGLGFVAEKMQFPTVFCRTPFRSARGICVRAGMVQVADFDFYTGSTSKLSILRYDHG